MSETSKDIWICFCQQWSAHNCLVKLNSLRGVMEPLEWWENMREIPPTALQKENISNLYTMKVNFRSTFITVYGLQSTFPSMLPSEWYVIPTRMIDFPLEKEVKVLTF